MWVGWTLLCHLEILIILSSSMVSDFRFVSLSLFLDLRFFLVDNGYLSSYLIHNFLADVMLRLLCCCCSRSSWGSRLWCISTRSIFDHILLHKCWFLLSTCKQTMQLAIKCSSQTFISGPQTTSIEQLIHLDQLIELVKYWLWLKRYLWLCDL